MVARAVNITDRAKRYRAQNNVTGPRKCVLCGSRSDLGVMHLTGNESHGETANLAYGCRSCNGKLAAAYKAVGAGKPTNQYNPSSGVPTFEQYMWAVSNHERKAHDAGGAVIHATPKHKRIEYARRIVTKAQQTKRDKLDDRWNPAFDQHQESHYSKGEAESAVTNGTRPGSSLKRRRTQGHTNIQMSCRSRLITGSESSGCVKGQEFAPGRRSFAILQAIRKWLLGKYETQTT